MAQASAGAQASRLTKDLTLKSPSRTAIPRILYGTAWKKDLTEDLVYKALKNGFRGIDTAAQRKHYNERGASMGVIRAVKDRLVKREDIFIQTKFTPPSGDEPVARGLSLKDVVHQSVKNSLRLFQYSSVEGNIEQNVDCLVLHSPFDDFEDTLTVWRTLQEYTPHSIRNLGISNTSLSTLQALHEAGFKPAVVQNRFYEGTAYEIELRKFCKDHDIVFQSFWTLSANPALARSSPVLEVAENAEVPVVAAFYSLVLGLEGITILDGTTNEVHMTEDLDGIEKVGLWAEGNGMNSWNSALNAFKELIGDT